jgi:hypothetical protein
MKVFLSWSGTLSWKVACTFRDWLPSVVQSIKPYVSSEDIDKGVRWSTDIAQELNESSFGIVCVTRDNLQAPWVNFEAGALSKTFDKSKVCPFLFNIKRSEVQGPLLQFQSAVYEKEEVEKLLFSINSSLPDDEKLEETRLRKSFDVWWPELKLQLDILKKADEAGPQPKQTPDKEAAHTILEELLELSRDQTKLLRSPTDLMPRGYLEACIRDAMSSSWMEERQYRVRDDSALDFLRRKLLTWDELLSDMKRKAEVKTDSQEFKYLLAVSDELMDVVRHLTRNLPADLSLETRRPTPRTK